MIQEPLDTSTRSPLGRSNKPVLLPGSQIFLIPGIYYVAHALEELPGFAVWASRHFSSTSPFAFALFEIPTILLVLLASYKAFTNQRHGGWVVFAIAAQIQFGLNALFHLSTALIFHEYVPGMVIGATLGIPLTLYFVKRVWQEKRVSKKEMIVATILGVVIAGAAIALL